MARNLTGRVTSDKVEKTIVITVTERKTHPLYKKQYSVNTKFMAHDEKNEAKLGDVVQITETRPLSARKRFSLSRIIERGGVRFEEADATADVPVEEPKVKEVKVAPAKASEVSDKTVDTDSDTPSKPKSSRRAK
jgi:small subunit ribosomal protein S17